jgi:O-antigen biosynthesis protein WbqP
MNQAPAAAGGAYVLVKRLADLILGAAILGLVSPVMLITAAAIRVDSAGPAIFRQRRIGRRGRTFTVKKFRTMRLGTPDLPSDALSDEQRRSRTTRLGGFLRRSCLDELPQLFNVIAGDMSLVGPRPALYNQDELIRMRRALGVDQVRPGITGLAQVEGRDALSLEEKVAYDAQYVRRLSPAMDVWIALRTIGAIMRGRGAN